MTVPSWLADFNRHLKPEPDGSGLKENFGEFIRQIDYRWRRENWPAYLLVDGARLGVGKSTCGIQIARALFPGFGLEHVIFRGRDLEAGLLAAPEWGFVMVDEPRDLMANKGRRDRELEHIMSTLGSWRKNHVGAILIAPDTSWYDALVSRGRMCPWWVFVEEPGVGRLHDAWDKPNYRLSQRFKPFQRSRIGRIGFDPVDPVFFGRYTDLAKEKNRQFAQEGAEREARRAGRANPNPVPSTGPDRTLPQGGGGGPVVDETYPCPVCGLRCYSVWNRDKHRLARHPGVPTGSAAP